MSETVNTSANEGVAVVELNRPEACNALNPEMARALRQAIDGTAGGDAVRCVIIRGAGQNFMAGGDLKAFHSILAKRPGQRKAEIEKLFPDVNATILAVR